MEEIYSGEEWKKYMIERIVFFNKPILEKAKPPYVRNLGLMINNSSNSPSSQAKLGPDFTHKRAWPPFFTGSFSKAKIPVRLGIVQPEFFYGCGRHKFVNYIRDKLGRNLFEENGIYKHYYTHVVPLACYGGSCFNAESLRSAFYNLNLSTKYLLLEEDPENQEIKNMIEQIRDDPGYFDGQSPKRATVNLVKQLFSIKPPKRLEHKIEIIRKWIEHTPFVRFSTRDCASDEFNHGFVWTWMTGRQRLADKQIQYKRMANVPVVCIDACYSDIAFGSGINREGEVLTEDQMKTNTGIKYGIDEVSYEVGGDLDNIPDGRGFESVELDEHHNIVSDNPYYLYCDYDWSKNLIIHFTVSGWHIPEENKRRLSEFKKAATAFKEFGFMGGIKNKNSRSPSCYIRIVTNHPSSSATDRIKFPFEWYDPRDEQKSRDYDIISEVRDVLEEVFGKGRDLLRRFVLETRFHKSGSYSKPFRLPERIASGTEFLKLDKIVKDWEPVKDGTTLGQEDMVRVFPMVCCGTESCMSCQVKCFSEFFEDWDRYYPERLPELEEFNTSPLKYNPPLNVWIDPEEEEKSRKDTEISLWESGKHPSQSEVGRIIETEKTVKIGRKLAGDGEFDNKDFEEIASLKQGNINKIIKKSGIPVVIGEKLSQNTWMAVKNILINTSKEVLENWYEIFDEKKLTPKQKEKIFDVLFGEYFGSEEEIFNARKKAFEELEFTGEIIFSEVKRKRGAQDVEIPSIEGILIKKFLIPTGISKTKTSSATNKGFKFLNIFRETALEDTSGEFEELETDEESIMLSFQETPAFTFTANPELSELRGDGLETEIPWENLQKPVKKRKKSAKKSKE